MNHLVVTLHFCIYNAQCKSEMVHVYGTGEQKEISCATNGHTKEREREIYDISLFKFQNKYPNKSENASFDT